MKNKSIGEIYNLSIAATIFNMFFESTSQATLTLLSCQNCILPDFFTLLCLLN